MKLNPVTVILSLIFLYPMLRGFFLRFSSHDLKEDIQELNKNISLVVGIFGGIYLGKILFLRRNNVMHRKLQDMLPADIYKGVFTNKFVIYFVMFPLMIYLVYKLAYCLFEVINRITSYPMLDGVEECLKDKSILFKRMIGSIFQLPRAFAYVLIVCLVLNIASMLNVNKGLNKYLEKSEPYKKVCKQFIIPVTNSKIARQLPNILNNSVKIEIRKEEPSSQSTANANGGNRTITYYNGITLEEGVQSNKEIDSKALQLVKNEGNTKGKAKILYNWVGSNIEYDHDKAERIMRSDFSAKSGAIPTYDTGKGICFDYACLYAAMCRADGIKVRIITGEGFNGISWVSHAWNQVYIPEEGKWINVDATFYRGGNYFSSNRFSVDHKNSQVAGEW